MAKTGDTPFVMEEICIVMDESVFLPVGALNQLRREATKKLLDEMLSAYRRSDASVEIDTLKDYADSGKKHMDERSISEPRYSCLIENRAVLLEIVRRDRISRVYLDFCAYRWNHFPKELCEDMEALHAAGKEVYFALPRIFRAEASDLFEHYQTEWKDVRPDGVLVRNYEELSSVETYFGKTDVMIDHNLYTYNDRASKFFESLNIRQNTVPLELNRGEIIHRDNTQSAMVVYGYYPLMTTAPCVHANTLGCDRKPGLCFLKDRYRVVFPVKNDCDACYNVVYNSLPVMLFTNMKELTESGMQEFRLDFTIEKPEEAKEVLNLMEEFVTGQRNEYPVEWKDRYTNGHYKRGVE